MKGEVNVRIRNNKNEYNFTLHRNITVLRGKSGTGKSTLYRMVASYSREGKASGIHASTTGNVPLRVLEGSFWKDEIRKISDSVVLIDEDSSFINSREFARLVLKSSNYYLLITRLYLPNIPYSIHEIYQVTGSKNKKFVPVYEGNKDIYVEPHIPPLPFHPDLVITEDRKSGYQFFKNVCSGNNIACISAGGKSNVISVVRKHLDQNIAVIADGAAFGPEIEDLAEIQQESDHMIAIFLPESFEWLILKSGIIMKSDSPELENPSAYIESSEYASWEQYFTRLLTDLSGKKKYGHYSKKKLDEWYLQKDNKASVCHEIPGLDLKKSR